MKLRVTFALLAATALAGCVNVTTRAQRIQVHPATSAVIASCTKVGRIDAKASGWGTWTYDQMNQQAEADLRDAVAVTYGDRADSVVLLNIETYTNSAVAHGIAYRCF